MLRETVMVMALMASSGTVRAQETDEGEIWGLQFVGSQCGPSGLVKVDLQDLVEEPERWQGRCVSVKGFKGQRSLFFDPADTRVPGHPSTDELYGRRVGLYGLKETMDRLGDTPQGSRIEVTGMVSSCRALHKPNVVMLFGYCHYTGGPVLIMSDFVVLRASTRSDEN